MKKKCVNLKKLSIICLISFIILSTVSGCKEDSQSSILVIGSTALQPLAEQAAKMFMYDNPDVSVQVQGGGSGNGLTSVSQGSADIGNSDIFAEEKSGIDYKSLSDYKVAVTGFAVISNKGVGVEDLTQSQLVDIFTGKISNWKDAGGNDVPVVVINRPSSSGTRAAFKKYGLKGAVETSSGKTLTQDSSGSVLLGISETPGAISYIGLSYINDNKSINVIKIDGVSPNAENISNGKYKIWAYEHMYTKGPAKGAIKDYIDYVTSDKMKPYIKKLGYIPIGDMKVSR
jgi:phosphate transport system substrate-binding protein